MYQACSVRFCGEWERGCSFRLRQMFCLFFYVFFLCVSLSARAERSGVVWVIVEIAAFFVQF